jgi:endoglucanase
LTHTASYCSVARILGTIARRKEQAVSKQQLKMLEQLVNLPTAPFVETHVIEFIRAFVAKRPTLTMSRDRFGNLLIRYIPELRKPITGRPVLFAAHMDHPGFVATKMESQNRVRAEFHGWVRKPFFKNAGVQFFSDGKWINATIEKTIPQKPTTATASARTFGADSPPAEVIAKTSHDIAPGSPGMWQLPDAQFKGTRLHARVCDDIAGLAAILCMLDAICKKKIAVPTYAFFTRAEEVGFAGALAAVSAGTVPKKTIVVAVENSKAITGVSIGDGPVLRVGDKATVFTPAATAYCHVVADQLAKQDKRFQYQRKLMDGGTCESTAYCHYGYDATGICLPLANYHNMDDAKGKIGPESIDTRDFLNLVKWFVALAQSPATMKFDGKHPGLDARLKALLKTHRPRLVKTAKQ